MMLGRCMYPRCVKHATCIAFRVLDTEGRLVPFPDGFAVCSDHHVAVTGRELPNLCEAVKRLGETLNHSYFLSPQWRRAEAEEEASALLDSMGIRHE